MQLALDAGNSSIKFGLFKDSDLIEFGRIEYGSDIRRFLNQNYLNQIEKIVFSSVVDDLNVTNLPKVAIIHITAESSFPFKNNYETPATLGIDRLVACVGAHKTGEDTLVIDAGSCLTFDFVSKDKGYMGGAISPGIAMRFQAMNNFTDQLPLISEFENQPNMLGTSTTDCLKSGVINGIKGEIESFITHFKSKSENLKVFLTGGDASFLGTELKSGIFADQNLVLKGLNNLIDLND